METNPMLERVWELVEPLALEAGLEIVDIEHRREGRGTVLRLLMDKPGGVSIDELGAVSRQVADVLDVHDDAVPGSYTLEVSSPGINRPLTRPQHFASFLGKRIHVRTRVALGERHSFRGTLTAVNDTGIGLTSDDGVRHEIPFDQIARANYQHDFSTQGTAHRPSPARRNRRRNAHQATR